MAPTTLWPFKMCPTTVQTAAVAITNGHSVNVDISFETVTNTVYISSRFSYIFFLWQQQSMQMYCLIQWGSSVVVATQLSTHQELYTNNYTSLADCTPAVISYMLTIITSWYNISKNQALQIVYLKHHDNAYKTSYIFMDKNLNLKKSMKIWSLRNEHTYSTVHTVTNSTIKHKHTLKLAGFLISEQHINIFWCIHY